MLWGSRDAGETTWLSAAEILSYRDDIAAFESVAAYTGTGANLTGGQEPERVAAAAVTTNLFHTLGVAPLAGRAFGPGDSAAAVRDQVIISHGLWQTRFGSDPNVLGKSLVVNDRPRTIIGVAPPSMSARWRKRPFTSRMPTVSK